MSLGYQLLYWVIKVLACSALLCEGSVTVEISYAFHEINKISPTKSGRNQHKKSEITACARTYYYTRMRICSAGMAKRRAPTPIAQISRGSTY